MKKTVLFLALVSAVALTSCKENKKDKTKTEKPVEVETVKEEGNVNISTSAIQWKGTKPGGAHNGTVNLSTGTLAVEDGKIKGGNFNIDLNSIKCLDIEDEEQNTKLVNHLKNSDFFDTERFPSASFEIASAEEKDGKLSITGNLKIKNETKSITFPASFSEENDMYVLKSDPFKIDRTDFGITYKSKSIDAALKDKFIDDLMEFTFLINAKK